MLGSHNRNQGEFLLLHNFAPPKTEVQLKKNSWIEPFDLKFKFHWLLVKTNEGRTSSRKPPQFKLYLLCITDLLGSYNRNQCEILLLSPNFLNADSDVKRILRRFSFMQFFRVMSTFQVLMLIPYLYILFTDEIDFQNNHVNMIMNKNIYFFYSTRAGVPKLF